VNIRRSTHPHFTPGRQIVFVVSWRGREGRVKLRHTCWGDEHPCVVCITAEANSNHFYHFGAAGDSVLITAGMHGYCAIYSAAPCTGVAWFIGSWRVVLSERENRRIFNALSLKVTDLRSPNLLRMCI